MKCLPVIIPWHAKAAGQNHIAMDSSRPEDNDDILLFGQYLRSPSSSPPPPYSVCSKRSEMTLIGVERTRTNNSPELPTESIAVSKAVGAELKATAPANSGPYSSFSVCLRKS